MDWFLYDIGLRHERVNKKRAKMMFLMMFYDLVNNFIER